MVIGIDKFREYFSEFAGRYIIIGGTACDIEISKANLNPRGTRDIDIVLVIEALESSFVQRFWEFVKAGQYKHKEKESDKNQYYRFHDPQTPGFPFMIELFARKPDVFTFPQEARFTPIPIDDEISSLSAILLDDDYYYFTIRNCIMDDGIYHANAVSLICLKAKAFLDFKDRKKKGEHVDSAKIRKHNFDVFRMASLLTPTDIFELPKSIKLDLQRFLLEVANEMPSKDMFRSLGATALNAEILAKQIVKNFELSDEET